MSAAREYWNRQAAHYDDEPDHGLGDPAVRRAWRALLGAHLPSSSSDVIDLGCGTGSLALLLAQSGHRVRGLDVAEAMLAAASRKAAAAGLSLDLTVGDATDPPFPDGSADVVLTRHVLWAMPDPAGAVRRWDRLLRPEGRLVLVEGRWHTGSGLPAATVLDALRRAGHDPDLHRLDDAAYWGGRVTDERYLVVSRR